MSHLILVVDDEPAIRQAVQLVLEDENFTVATAPNGAAALALLDTICPDAILLDLCMPIMDGYEFLAAYRDRPDGNAVVIVCSTYASRSRLRELDADGFIGKPFDINELIELLQTLLQQPGRRPASAAARAVP